MSNFKKCSLCGEVKPLTEFYKRASMKDGHRSECKVCNNEKRTARKNRSAYPVYTGDFSARMRNLALYLLIMVAVSTLTIIGWIWK